MIDFGLWSLKEAKAYRDAYAAAVPVRERWLADELRARGDDPGMLSGPNRLPALWALATALIDTGPTSVRLQTPQPSDEPQPGIRPPWHDQDQPSPFFSDGALWLIELLGAHLATLISASAPEAHWDVYRAPRRKHDVDQHRTKLFGTRPAGVDPSRMVYGAVIGHVHHGKPWDQQETLETLYDYAITSA
jgi:hypothetical protein